MATKWEYHYEQIEPQVVRTLTQWQALCADLGEEGWEQTGTIHAADQGDFMVFKRPL